jgi:S-adenosylmethionine:tRNA ribosyltransferase-isomerase
MRAATQAAQRPPGARLLVVHADGTLQPIPRAQLAYHLSPGDLVVANDAARIPASLAGLHEPSGATIEVRLAGRRSLSVGDVYDFTAIVFGPGDYRTLTEERELPPTLRSGDVLTLGPLKANVKGVLGHPRLVRLGFEGTPDEIWSGIARHGTPIQYAHIEQPLRMWDAWTQVASLPVSFEPPSASFVIDWAFLQALQARGVGFATLTLAAGISSTGDAALDARLPFDEAYRLPTTTVRAISRTRATGGRVIALGTTVTRALEHAAAGGWALRPGSGLATQLIGPETRLRVVDAIVSGVYEPGESHYQLLRAFANDVALKRMSRAFKQGGYRSHEFGDSVLIMRQPGAPVSGSPHDPPHGDEMLHPIGIQDIRDSDAAGAAVDELVSTHVEADVAGLVRIV